MNDMTEEWRQDSDSYAFAEAIKNVQDAVAEIDGDFPVDENIDKDILEQEIRLLRKALAEALANYRNMQSSRDRMRNQRDAINALWGDRRALRDALQALYDLHYDPVKADHVPDFQAAMDRAAELLERFKEEA